LYRRIRWSSNVHVFEDRRLPSDHRRWHYTLGRCPSCTRRHSGFSGRLQGRPIRRSSRPISWVRVRFRLYRGIR
jgi:hypothetical protein